MGSGGDRAGTHPITDGWPAATGRVQCAGDLDHAGQHGVEHRRHGAGRVRPGARSGRRGRSGQDVLPRISEQRGAAALVPGPGRRGGSPSGRPRRRSSARCADGVAVRSPDPRGASRPRQRALRRQLPVALGRARRAVVGVATTSRGLDPPPDVVGRHQSPEARDDHARIAGDERRHDVRRRDGGGPARSGCPEEPSPRHPLWGAHPGHPTIEVVGSRRARPAARSFRRRHAGSARRLQGRGQPDLGDGRRPPPRRGAARWGRWPAARRSSRRRPRAWASTRASSGVCPTSVRCSPPATCSRSRAGSRASGWCTSRPPCTACRASPRGSVASRRPSWTARRGCSSRSTTSRGCARPSLPCTTTKPGARHSGSRHRPARWASSTSRRWRGASRHLFAGLLDGAAPGDLQHVVREGVTDINR